jgi:pSer/pThr/pTyr-binding forkhead associated (FHA) protein
MPVPSPVPMLVQLQGDREGRELALPEGDSILGRSRKADIFLDGNNVSRRHALLRVSEHGTAVIEDLDSTNGTWVNGDRLLGRTRRRLSNGDLVQLGDVQLRFQGPRSAETSGIVPDRRSARSSGHPRQRRRVVIIAGICELAIAIISASSNIMSTLFGSLVTAVVGILCALAVMFFEYIKERPSDASAEAGASNKAPRVVYWMGGPYRMAVPQRPGLTGVLAVVLVLGIGGVGLGFAANYLIGPIPLISGPAKERLAGERTTEESGLSLTVTSVEEMAGVTRVRIKVTNHLNTAVTLPVFGNCQLSTTEGQTLGADPFLSKWETSVPPNQVRQGVVAFEGQFPNAEASVTLTFVRVFGGPSVPESLAISDLILVSK